MALRPQGAASFQTTRLPPVVFDHRLARDLVHVMTEANARHPERSKHDELNFKVNEYTADTLEDILEFDRPITSILILSLMRPAVTVSMNMHRSEIHWFRSDLSPNLVERIEEILRRRAISVKRKLAIPRSLVPVMAASAVVGFGLPKALEAMGHNPPLLIGLVAELIVQLIYVMFLAVRPYDHARKINRASLTDHPVQQENWIKRYSTEITIVLVAMSTVIPVAIALL